MLSGAPLPLKLHPWLLMDYSHLVLYQLEEEIGKSQDINQFFFEHRGQVDEPIRIS